MLNCVKCCRDAMHNLKSDEGFDGRTYNPGFWLGYSYSSRAWRDAGGSSPATFNWNTNEPGTGDDCVAAAKAAGFKWNGLKCAEYQYTICQGISFR